MTMDQIKNQARRRLPLLPENPDAEKSGRFPKWLHRPLPKGDEVFQTESILRKYGLNTVCEEAKCPNRTTCFSKKTATFLIMGKECTRACGFCDIDFAKTPKPLDREEPMKVALSVHELGLEHVVITMVARDDLSDQGASHLVEVMRAVRRENPRVTLEILTSDYNGDWRALDLVLAEKPEIFNHNLETVERLTPRVRHRATYERSLAVLAHAKASRLVPFIKSGIMVGLSETGEEVVQTLTDLHRVGVDIVTIGHYLQASRIKIPVKEFVTPETFQEYKIRGESLGIPHIYSGPFVRSSFNAKEIREVMNERFSHA